ncbi:uncharacterized protein LOC132554727 [Ylistrum balloti]|uniref:uncharacterized protein LOC132554727 n=1 Tax=Ylistrum balloti TaxID=509963 RepID=UPI00290587EB|nr:uncharacterized protein LOC132554727 [Ylistrum balloti]
MAELNMLLVLTLASVVCSTGAWKLAHGEGMQLPGIKDIPPNAYFHEEYLEIPSSNTTEGINVDISSVFPGDVAWIESSDGNVGIYAVSYQERHGYTSKTEPEIQIKASLTSRKLEIRIYPMDPLPLMSLPLNGAKFVSVNVLCLTLAVMVSLLDHRVGLLLGIVVSCSLVSSVDTFPRSSDVRCNVVIHYPKNITFSNISIVVPEGNISIPPKEKMNQSGDVWCSTNHTATGCAFCCHGNGFCGPGNVCTCTGNYDNESDCESELKPKFKLYTGRMDPRLARFHSLDLYQHLIIGKRRDDGVARMVTEIMSRDEAGNEIVIGVKKGKQIKDIIVTGSERKRIQWINSCTILVTSENEHDSTVLNTCDTHHEDRKNDTKKKRKRKKKDITILSIKQESVEAIVEKSSRTVVEPTNENDFLSASFKILSSDDNHAKWKKTFTKVPIDVKRCGEGDLSSTVYASVLVKESDRDMMPVLEYKAIADYYPGSFYVKLPAKQNTDKILSNENAHPLRICNHFRKTAIKVCHKNRRLLASNISESCASLVSRTDRQNISEDVRQSVKDTCERGYFALKSYCDNAAMIADSNLCLELFTEQETFYVSEDTHVIFNVVFPDGHTVRSPVYRFNSSAAHVTETVVLKGINVIPKILNFSINPPDPHPNQGYEAIIRYKCVSDTTKLHMRVEGDDSYTSDVTCYGNQQCNCCTLHVAGATAHVTDTVKIELSDSTSGVNITQQYRVMF